MKYFKEKKTGNVVQVAEDFGSWIFITVNNTIEEPTRGSVRSEERSNVQAILESFGGYEEITDIETIFMEMI